MLVLQAAQLGHPPLKTLTCSVRGEGGSCFGRSCPSPLLAGVVGARPQIHWLLSAELEDCRDAAAAVAVRGIWLLVLGALK